jgi:hypothetical protein
VSVCQGVKVLRGLCRVGYGGRACARISRTSGGAALPLTPSLPHAGASLIRTLSFPFVEQD